MEPVIAIDGPSGAGKSSVSRAVAQRGGWRYLDTGALYRAMTLGLLRQGLSGVNVERGAWICTAMATIKIDVELSPSAPKVFLAGVEVGPEIRGAEVTKNVSEVSALPCVRAKLLAMQRHFIASGGIVVEGRDIGSTVWPQAEVKFHLTADLAARASRRHAEIADQQGIGQVELSLAERDQIDSTRIVSPLTIAPDAILIDTTNMTFEAVVDRIWAEIESELTS